MFCMYVVSQVIIEERSLDFVLSLRISFSWAKKKKHENKEKMDVSEWLGG